MSLARTLLLRASRSSFLAHNLMRRPFAQRAVRRFMPGETLEAALDAAATIAAGGMGTVVTKLGENLSSLAEAEAVRDHYLGVFDAIAARRLDAWPSVKPTQLGLDLSLDACFANLAALAAKADATGSLLWVDMEDSSYVDRTLDLFRRLREKHTRVGLCLQSYLRRTPADLQALLPLKPVIRLVKGAYAEPEHVAFPAKRDVDLAYYELGVKLLEAAAKDGTLTVFGTHDTALVDRLVGRAEQAGLAADRYEIHMLYGIGTADQQRLAARGSRVKVLISYGSAWFPWYMRRLAERPANVWFVVKSVLG